MPINEAKLMKALKVDEIWQETIKTQKEMVDSVADLVSDDVMDTYKKQMEAYRSDETKELYKQMILNKVKAAVESKEVTEKAVNDWIKMSEAGSKIMSVLHESVNEIADYIDDHALGGIDKSKLN